MWGSDLIAEAIADLGFEFAAINPGASYRGLHDSFVNHLDNRIPLIVCLHEEHAVALAHGWTKVTERPALAIVHSNVGLMHAVMPLYNAWVDRAPVVLLNATGPRDATDRRPWIEWIHTAQDPAGLVRNFVKWDDQPGSARASVDSLAEAALLAGMDPKGPTFVCIDVADQESRVERPAARRRALAAPVPVGPDAAAIAAVAERLACCKKIVLLVGRTDRSEAGWADRIALAERLGTAVVTDIKTAAGFPTDHPQSVGAPGFSLDPRQRAALAECDAIIALDWIDLQAAMRHAPEDGYVVAASLDPVAARGWVKNTYGQPAVDVMFPITSEALVSGLLALLPGRAATAANWWAGLALPREVSQPASLTDAVVYAEIARGLAEIRAEMPVAVTRYPLGWPADLTTFAHPLDYLGRDGGEGLASGPGIVVGVALALKDCGRLPIAVLGDGDFAMGATALWTAASADLPLVIIVAANGVYGNDVVHQERIATERQRPVEGKWVGQRIDHPRLDIAGLARAQGVEHAVRVEPGNLIPALVAAARHARTGGPALVEVAMTVS